MRILGILPIFRAVNACGFHPISSKRIRPLLLAHLQEDLHLSSQLNVYFASIGLVPCERLLQRNDCPSNSVFLSGYGVLLLIGSYNPCTFSDEIGETAKRPGECGQVESPPVAEGLLAGTVPGRSG